MPGNPLVNVTPDLSAKTFTCTVCAASIAWPALTGDQIAQVQTLTQAHRDFLAAHAH